MSARIDNRGFHAVPAKDGKGRTVYCGPFCLAAATGLSIEEILADINSWRGNRADKHIGGTFAEDLRAVLDKRGLGYGVEKLFYRSKQPTFTQWIKTERSSRKDYYIVLVTGHWVLLRGDWLTDTCNVKAVDLSAGKNPYARKRVQAVVRIYS